MQKGTSLERGSSFQQMMQEQLAFYAKKWDFPGGSDGKASAYNAGDRFQSLGLEDLLEKEMATHSGILAGKIPWTVDPGRLQSVRSQRHN